ncbi:ZNFX1 (predicted) [Pycnogonum litorale]
MCGEPCPDKCRICNKDEVQEIIFGNEDEPDARFVQLDDCKHVIEVDAMDAWMDPKSTERDASTAIMMKACPRCKTVIRRTLRYKNIVNLYLGDVERVKCMNFGDTKHNKLEMSKIKNRIELEFSNCPSSFGLSSLLSDMLEFVKVESKKSTKERITYLQNLCLITFKFLEKCRKLRSNSKLGTCDQIKTYMYFLCSWLEKNMRDATVQQLKEFTNELTRFILFVDLKTLAISESAVSEVDAKRKYKEAEQMLLALKPLDDSAKCDLRETIKKITKSMGGLKISEIERIQIIRAMGLSPGHYFKCPNGHIYAIGECGGAMETSKCPECKEVIGGRSHKLTEGNKHAREMDRSKHPAWSDANNMRNYRF